MLLNLYLSVQCSVDHYLVLVRFVLLNLYLSVQCFVDHCLCFCPSVFSGDIVAQSLLFCELLCRSLFVPLSSVLSGDLVAHSLLLCEVFCRSLLFPLSFRS